MTGVWVDGRELSEAEVRAMDERIERVFADVNAGRPEVSMARPADLRDVKERVSDAIKGRDQDREGFWKQVMEHWGFNWLEPKDLDAVVGPQRYIPSAINGLAGEKIHDALGRQIPNSSLYWTRDHDVGQWRSDHGSRRPPKELTRGRALAFTMVDLIDLFGEPKAFDEWAKKRCEETKRARQRVVDQQRWARRR